LNNNLTNKSHIKIDAMAKLAEEKLHRRMKKFLEDLFKESRLYRDLVYLSRIVKMLIYLGTGVSILIMASLGKPMGSLQDLLIWMTQTIFGRIIAIFIAFSLIIYGLEKLR